MKGYEWHLTHSLEKVFPDRMPEVMGEEDALYVWRGEVPAVQLVYGREAGMQGELPVGFTCEVTGFPAQVRMRDVELVPSAFPCYEKTDDNYISTQPGLFPDLLKPRKNDRIVPRAGQYRAVWIDFPDIALVPAGSYTVEVKLTAQWPETRSEEADAKEVGEHGADKETAGTVISQLQNLNRTLRFQIYVAEASLPKQKLIHTEWFHTDCIADYYHTPVFSELHWKAIEKQIRMAAELGVNMLLAPVFTPPLDTQVGGERTTVQLVGIRLEGEQYTFDFTLLERWCRLCREAGIAYIEIPHLFTQWGALATPKIVVTEACTDGDGTGAEGMGVDEAQAAPSEIEGKKFGWHVPADSPSYRHFLESFLPALQDKLLELGYTREQIYFHISDEPSEANQESYARAKAVAADLLDGWLVVDALSDYSFYEKGLVDLPVAANDHIQAFADHKVENLWVYYCCAQGYEVPNRFFAMPSARNRIMGVLMYLYGVQGFLHWGFNFYNTQFSLEHLDPFFDTHGGYAFPSGDTFLVYPGPDGEPYSSVRAQVQAEGLADLRALQGLEERVGRQRVLELIYEGQDGPFTFKKYPKEAAYLYELRKKIAKELLMER